PLRCDFVVDPDDMTSYFATAMTYDGVGQCRQKLEKVANLNLYTTPIAMDDLDDVRRALGYDKINIYGGSYGTRAGLVYIRQHGDHVRVAVLEGVTPANHKLPLHCAEGVQNALNRLFDDCAADQACHKAYPDLKADFNAALGILDKRPVKVEAYNPVKKQNQQITLSRGSFVEHVRFLLYSPDLMTYLPLAIHQSAGGNFEGLVALGFTFDRQVLPLINQGMAFSVLCAEDAPFITEDDIKRPTAGTYYGDWSVRRSLNACQQWPRAKIPPDYSQPVKSDVPVLMVSGEIDPVTPASAGAEALRFLTHGRQIVGKSWSHGSASDCVDRLMADFIAGGSADGLDASCMEKIARPPFFTGEGLVPRTSHEPGTAPTTYN